MGWTKGIFEILLSHSYPACLMEFPQGLRPRNGESGISVFKRRLSSRRALSHRQSRTLIKCVCVCVCLLIFPDFHIHYLFHNAFLEFVKTLLCFSIYYSHFRN